MRTRCRSESNAFRAHTEGERLAEVYPRCRTPEDREAEDVQYGERDEAVTTHLLRLRQLVDGSARRREQEVADEASNERAYSLKCGAGHEGLN